MGGRGREGEGGREGSREGGRGREGGREKLIAVYFRRDLSHNNLTAFPAGFNSVHAYTTFFINNNPIGNLSRGLFHGTVTRIETL